MEESWNRKIYFLSILLVMILAAVSYCGAFIPLTYDLETPSMAAQGVGQDLVNLFIVVPFFIFILFRFHKAGVKRLLVLGGLVLYVLYSFVIYAMGVHFNYLFLWYCAILGLAVYVFIFTLVELGRHDFTLSCGKSLRIGTSVFLISIAILFYGLWLKEIVIALLAKTAPQSVQDYNLLVNPVHVEDISFILPGLILSAVLFLKKHRWADVLVPVALVFILLMALALIGMVLVLQIRQVGEDWSIAGIFLVLAIISFVLLRKLFQQVEHKKPLRLNL